MTPFYRTKKILLLSQTFGISAFCTNLRHCNRAKLQECSTINFLKVAKSTTTSTQELSNPISQFRQFDVRDLQPTANDAAADKTNFANSINYLVEQAPHDFFVPLFCKIAPNPRCTCGSANPIFIHQLLCGKFCQCILTKTILVVRGKTAHFQD